MQPVKKQIKKFVLACTNNDEYQRQLEALIRVMKTPEWKFVIQILWNIKNEMAIELLQSSKYTLDDSENKDITQKVYHNISEMIDFLTDPRNWIAKKGMIQLLTQKFKGEDTEPETKE